MNTRALVTHILEAKGLDSGDRVLAKSVAERLIHALRERLIHALRKSVAERLIHALRMQAKRGKIAIKGKERGAIVWQKPNSFTPDSKKIVKKKIFLLGG